MIILNIVSVIFILTIATGFFIEAFDCLRQKIILQGLIYTTFHLIAMVLAICIIIVKFGGS